MKKKFIEMIKNFSYSLSSNLISLVISTLVILIIPKIIGVEEYGFWQLYLFYSSYTGFLLFGWNDGIYLRYGGEEYEYLDKSIFFSQFYTQLLSQIILSLLLLLFSVNLITDSNRLFIVQIISIEFVVVNVRSMLLFVLQSTNRIKDASKITIIDRIVYIIFVAFLLLSGSTNYKLLIFADFIGKTGSLLYVMYLCRDIVFRKISDFKNTFDETVSNINAGIKLMFANIANMLIIGIVRFGIERNWSVAIFGQISLTLSVSNMFLVFINSLGLVIYPLLRRIREDSLPKIYSVMRDLLMAIVLGLLILYIPVKGILAVWLPEYAESLRYMGLLFPIIIYESKMSLLINTYMKALRKEKEMLLVNIVTVFFSIVFTVLSTATLDNLDLAILSIVILMAIRGIASELILSSLLNIRVVKDILLELAMTLIFIITAWGINSWITTVIYTAFYFIYLIIKRKDIKLSSTFILKIIRS